MNRRVYSLAALSMALAAGVMLAVTFSKVPLRSADGAQGAGTSPAGLAATLATTAASQLGALTAPAAMTGPATTLASGTLPLEPGAHDPAMIKEGDYYYVFYTGGLINELRSKDLIHWDPVRAAAPGAGAAGRGGRGRGGILPAAPAWLATDLPTNRGDLWAPDISFHDGKYFLYYAGSSFGSRNSGIGLSTNKTLDPASKDYKWEDVGLVVRTQQSDNYNAIDPNWVEDEKGQGWLDFGSFWSGIKLIKVGKDGKADPADKTMYSIAARGAGSTAIEAPFIIHEGRYFYLFVSWDRCCQGLRSTYRVMAGRAEKITGPYVDKDGVDMAKGGGTQLLAGDRKRIIGPGHEGLFKDGNRWLMVHHFYDGNTPNGTSRLQVRPVTFDEKGWPVVGKAMNSAG